MRRITDTPGAWGADVEEETIVDGPVDDAAAIDAELQAAIEYKIAISGIAGVEQILQYVNRALCRGAVR